MPAFGLFFVNDFFPGFFGGSAFWAAVAVVAVGTHMAVTVAAACAGVNVEIAVRQATLSFVMATGASFKRHKSPFILTAKLREQWGR